MSNKITFNCEKCGFNQSVKQGSEGARSYYNIFGCPSQKKLVSIDVLSKSEEEEKKKCGEDIIDYKDPEELKKIRENNGKWRCPCCNQNTMSVSMGPRIN